MKRVRLASMLVTAVLLAVAAPLAGCSHDEPPPEGPPTPSDSPTPAIPRASVSASATAGSAGSDGLTVRYLDRGGHVKTLQPKDFPR